MVFYNSRLWLFTCVWMCLLNIMTSHPQITEAEFFFFNQIKNPFKTHAKSLRTNTLSSSVKRSGIWSGSSLFCLPSLCWSDLHPRIATPPEMSNLLLQSLSCVFCLWLRPYPHYYLQTAILFPPASTAVRIKNHIVWTLINYELPTNGVCVSPQQSLTVLLCSALCMHKFRLKFIATAASLNY